MWVENITLTNIKCFQKQEIRTGTRSKPYPWITLLGENGVGKSTVLQALALLLAGPKAANQLLPSAEHWVRNENQTAEFKAVIHRQENDFLERNEKQKSFSIGYSIHGWDFQASLNENKALSLLQKDIFSTRTRGWFSCGYGPFRRSSKSRKVLVPSGLDFPSRHSNFITQFNEDQILSSFEQWFVHLDYRISRDNNDAEAQRMLNLGKRTINQLLPENARIDEITRDGIIQFRLNQQKIKISDLSDGYRSVITLAGDLIWRLLQSFPDIEDLSQANGVVLIDELDVHLHPSWQRRIAGQLRRIFPNIQFIVATHSPLIVSGAGEDAVTLHIGFKDGEMRVTPIEDLALSSLDADYILRAAFDLDSTHSPKTQEKIERYHELSRKRNHLNRTERLELEQLRKFMGNANPIGGPPEPGSLEAEIDNFLERYLR